MEGWVEKRVSDIAQHGLGKMLDKRKNKGVLKTYLRNTNVRWMEFDLSDLKQMRFLPEEEERYTARKGDVLVCEGGYPGRAAIWDFDEPIYFQKALHRVRFDASCLNTWFVFYILYLDLTDALKTHFTGAGIQHFTGKALAKLPIPIPPLPEQERIVAILDEAFAAIATATANAEKNLANARELFESAGHSMFSPNGKGWEHVPLNEVVTDDCSLSYGIVQPGPDYPNGIPVVRPTDLQDTSVELDGLKTIEPARSASYARTSLQGGEILLCVRGETGRASVASDALAGANVTRGIVPIRFHPARIASGFGYHLIMSRCIQKQIKAKTYGAALMQINIRDLRALTLSVPSLERQRLITEQLDDLSRITRSAEAIYARKSGHLANLKQSLLHKAFTGELTADKNTANRVLSEESV